MIFVYAYLARRRFLRFPACQINALGRQSSSAPKILPDDHFPCFCADPGDHRDADRFQLLARSNNIAFSTAHPNLVRVKDAYCSLIVLQLVILPA